MLAVQLMQSLIANGMCSTHAFIAASEIAEICDLPSDADKSRGSPKLRNLCHKPKYKTAATKLLDLHAFHLFIVVWGIIFVLFELQMLPRLD